MVDMIKVSLNTRRLVATVSANYAKLVANVKARFEDKSDTEVSVVNDLLVGRVAYVFSTHGHGDTDKPEDFVEAAQKLIDSDKTNTVYLSALKWVNRIRTAAGFPSKSETSKGNKGRTRKENKGSMPKGAWERADEAPVTAPIVSAPIVSAPTPVVAAPPKLALKVTESVTIGDNIRALWSAANKLLSENAATIHGDERDALVAMVAAGRKYEAIVNPLVEKPKPAPGARRAKLAKHFNKAPVSELAN